MTELKKSITGPVAKPSESIRMPKITVLICLSLLTSCSVMASEEGPSPIEKRNNFDACVINWLRDNVITSRESWDYYRPKAEMACVDLLE